MEPASFPRTRRGVPRRCHAATGAASSTCRWCKNWWETVWHWYYGWLSQVFSYYEKIGLYRLQFNSCWQLADRWHLFRWRHFLDQDFKRPIWSIIWRVMGQKSTPWKLGKYGHQMKKSAQSLFPTRVPKFLTHSHLYFPQGYAGRGRIFGQCMPARRCLPRLEDPVPDPPAVCDLQSSFTSCPQTAFTELPSASPRPWEAVATEALPRRFEVEELGKGFGWGSLLCDKSAGIAASHVRPQPASDW